jgi:predicted dehydrogenase
MEDRVDGSARTPLVVGLVGAGPWAAKVHGPVFAAGPETRLGVVWSRRHEAAEALARAHGAVAAPSYEALLDACDVVAFAVPPAVQEALAPHAARAGKALVLEKPLAPTLAGARRIADAVGEAGVMSVVCFSARFGTPARTFLAALEGTDCFGALYVNVSGAFLEGPYAGSPWRHEGGALLDIGPHAIDLLTAALGPTHDVRAVVRRGWVELTLHHDAAVSTALLSAHVPMLRRYRVEAFGPNGSVVLEDPFDIEAFARLRAELASTVYTGTPHECDVWRGLDVQNVLEKAIASVRG